MNHILHHQDKAAYLAADALDKSGIDRLLVSPAEYRYGPPTQATESMDMGTVVHALVLEPETVAEICHVAILSARSGAGKKERDDALAAGKIRLTRGKYALCRHAASALSADPVCRKLLDMPGEAEVSLYWDMPLGSGQVPCKARMDYLAELPDGSCIAVDLKTTSAWLANTGSLSYHIHKWHYERQAAWYLEGLQAVGLGCRQFVFLFVGMRSPHFTSAVRLTDTDIRHGWNDCLAAAKIWQRCMETGIWPSSPGSLATAGPLPGWNRSSVVGIRDVENMPCCGQVRSTAADRPQPAERPGQKQHLLSRLFRFLFGRLYGE